MEIITIKTKKLLEQAIMLDSDNEPMVEITLRAQDGNPSDGDDFYPAMIHFDVTHEEQGTDYGSIYSTIEHDNFDYEANEGEAEIKYVHASVPQLLEISKKAIDNKLDLVEIEYISRVKSAMLATPEFETLLIFTGYKSSNPDNKIDCGFISVNAS